MVETIVDKPKRMSVEEFRELGYLQELNRQFLHPLGLALEVIIDKENGSEKFGKVWDYRNEPGGMVFDDLTLGSDRFRKNFERIFNLQYKTSSERMKILGFFKQPV